MRTFSGEVNRTSRSVRAFEDSFSNMGRASAAPLQKLRDYVLILGNARLALMNLRDLSFGWVAGIMRSAGELERLTILMKGLSDATSEVGRTKDAEGSLRNLMSMARNSGFEVQTLADSFVKFRSAGLDPTVYSLQGLTNAVATFGGTSDVMHRASIAIQQMAGKGVISMEELRQQLGEAVPSAMKIMAYASGQTLAQFTKAVSTGMVQAKAPLQAMLRDMNLLYAGAGERIANSLFGQIAQVKTNFMALSADFAGMGQTDGLFSTTVKSFKDLNALMMSSEGRQFARDVGNGVAYIAETIADAARGMVTWNKEIGTAVKTFAIVFAAMKAADLARWSVGLLTEVRALGAGWVTTFNSMQASAGSFGQAVRGNFGAFTTAQTAAYARAQATVAMSGRAVTAAQAELAARQANTVQAQTELATSRSTVASAKTELETRRAAVLAMNSQRLSSIQSVNVERQRLDAARHMVTFAQRDIDLSGTNKARQDALSRAKTTVLMQENRLNDAKRAQLLAEERLTAAKRAQTVAEGNLTAAKTANITASNRAATAAAAEAAATRGVAGAQTAAAASTAALTLRMQAAAIASAVLRTGVALLGTTLALLTNPLTMIVVGLGYAAYSMGVFADKTNIATDAADRLKRKVGELADVQEAYRAQQESNRLLSNNSKGWHEIGFMDGIRTGDWMGAFSGLMSPSNVEAQKKKAREAGKAIGDNLGHGLAEAAQRDFGDYLKQREKVLAQSSADLQSWQKSAKIDERMSAGPKEAAKAVEEYRAKLAAAGTAKLAFDQKEVDRLTRLYDQAKKTGDKNDQVYFGAKLSSAAETLKQTRSELGLTGEAATLMGQNLAGATSGVDKIAKSIATANGVTAQMEARMNGANGALAKFNAELAGGKHAGKTKEQIDALRRAATATDALAASRRAASTNDAFDSQVGSMAGRLAQLNDELMDGQGNLAKFNAQVDADVYKDFTDGQVEYLRDLAQSLDDAEQRMSDKRIGDRLGREFSKAKVESDELWSSFTRDTMEADDRAAQLRSRFEGMLDGLSGNALDQARQRIEQIIQTMQAAQAARTAEDWRRSAEQMNIDLMEENDARRAQHEIDIAREQQKLDIIRQNAQLSAQAKRQAEEQFYAWKAAREQLLARQTEGAVTKMARDWSRLGANIQNSLAGAMGNFVDAMVEGKQSFSDFAGSLIKDLIKIILKAMIAYAIMSALGMTGGASFGDFMSAGITQGFGGVVPGTGATGGLGNGGWSNTPTPGTAGIGDDIGRFNTAHTGGVIGATGNWANVSASLFTGAKTYHGGGWIGGRQLKPGEVPMIGLDDEVVLTKEQQRLLGGSLGGALTPPMVQVNVINNSGTQLSAEQSEPYFNGRETIIDVVVDAMRKEGKMREAVRGANRG